MFWDNGLNCCCLLSSVFLQDSCPPIYCQPMKKLLIFQSRLPPLTPHFTQPPHLQTKVRNLLASPQQSPFTATLMHPSQLVPILHGATFRVLTTPTRNWHRAGTGASLGTLESKCAMARISWTSTDLRTKKKKHKERKLTHIITVIHRALRKALLKTRLCITLLQQTRSLLNDVFISAVLYQIRNLCAQGFTHYVQLLKGNKNWLVTVWCIVQKVCLSVSLLSWSISCCGNQPSSHFLCASLL